ncbi:hypothetical protein KAI92_03645 [Candidatus Parcubacteria bacterium]|nr:hypothetical protein [Candidatus Parcubacteria bacterium]
MKRLKKSLIVSLMSITVFAMSAVTAPKLGAASNGDLVKIEGSPAVYYLASSKRHVFPNESTYFSWYSDFNGIQIIAQSELEGFARGANVTMRPGTKLVTSPDESTVYAVEPGGVLRSIVSEANAIVLYGADWAANVVDIIPAFMSNYTDGDPLTEGAYPAGTLVKENGQADVYYLDADGTARKFADAAAFESNRFQWGDIVEAGTGYTLPTAGDSLTATEGLGDTSQGGGVGTGDIIDPLVGSGVSIALASDTPSAGNIPQASPVDFLKVNLTAASDGDVAINSITLSAYDLGNSLNIDTVTWYDDGVKIGSTKNMTSDRVAAFNFATPIAITAGETKALTVRATINGTGNYAIGIAGVSAITTNGASVSGTFPIVGNTKAIVTGTTIGTITMTAADTTSTVDAEFGEDDVLMAGFSLQGTNEPIIWESVRFRNGGNNNDALASNFRLLIDGDEVATVDAMVDRYVSFNIGSRVIAKNETINIEVYGDVGIGNAGDDVNLYIKETNDFSFVGQDFGYGIEPTLHANLDGDGDGYTINLTAGDFTIDMDKAATPSQDVRSGDNDVVLATINMVSNGEDATTAYIKDAAGDEFIISGTGLGCNEFENTELRDVDSGVTYDVTVASGSSKCLCTIDEEITFTKGVTRTFELRTDLNASTETNYPAEDDTLQVTLKAGAFSITGDVSDATITASPASIDSAVATVKDASLIVQQSNLTAKTIVPGATDFVVYKANLEVGNSSYIDITSVKISATGTSIISFDDDNISQLDLYIDNQLVKSKSGSIDEQVASRNSITFNSLDTTNRRIAAGDSVYMEVRATFTGDFQAKTGLFQLGLESATDSIVAKDMDSHAVVESGITINQSSRSVTLENKGTLKVELKIDDSKSKNNTYILAGSETTADRYLGELVFTTANESIKVTELILSQVGNANSSDLLAVNLYDENGIKVASKIPSADGHVYFSSFNHEFEGDQATSLYIGVTTKSINASGDDDGTATFGNTIKFTIATTTDVSTVNGTVAIKAIGVNSSEDITLAAAATATVGIGEWANSNFATTTVSTISGSVLTSIVKAMDDTTLTNETDQVIGKYKFVFNNGENRTAAPDNEELKAQMRLLTLTLATSSGVTVTNVQAYIDGDSANKTTATSTQASNKVVIDLTQLPTDTRLVDGEVTLVIEADVAVAGTGTKSLKTKIADLDATGGGDFTYNGNHSTGTTYWGDGESVLLDNIVEVQGTYLSNSF